MIAVVTKDDCFYFEDVSVDDDQMFWQQEPLPIDAGAIVLVVEPDSNRGYVTVLWNGALGVIPVDSLRVLVA